MSSIAEIKLFCHAHPMGDWLKTITELRGKKSRIVAGIMSGTSVDSIDVAICEISGAGFHSKKNKGARVALKSFYKHNFPAKLQKRIRNLERTSTAEISEIHAEIGELFAEAFLWAMHRAKVKVDLIGSHGQTVYHHSGKSTTARTTLQLGDGDRIAVRSGLPVFFDFRARDVAVDGEGAPLTPYADLVLFGTGARTGKKKRVVLNLGGIGNITILDSTIEKVLGFDTGPANAPLDRITRIITRGKLDYDKNGKLAQGGNIQFDVVERLLKEDSFIRRKPPKSTGTETYGDDFVKKLIKLCKTKDLADCLATATEFVARSIAFSIQAFVPNSEKLEIVIAGGGTQNKFLVERIRKAALPSTVVLSDDYGVPWHAREAMAFAIFANDALFGLNTSLPGVSGCSRPLTLGKLSFPG